MCSELDIFICKFLLIESLSLSQKKKQRSFLLIFLLIVYFCLAASNIVSIKEIKVSLKSKPLINDHQKITSFLQ